MVGEKSESAAKGEGGDLNKWFEKGKYICFREKVIPCGTGNNTPWYIFTITPHLLHQSFIQLQTHTPINNNNNNDKKKKIKQLDLLFNHKLRHESEVQLPLTYDIVPLQFQDVTPPHNNKSNNKNKKIKLDSMFNHYLRHMSQVPMCFSYDIVPQEFQELKDASWVVLGSTVYFFGANGRKILYLKTPLASTASPVSLNFESAGRMVKKRKAPKVVAQDGKIYVFGNNKKVFTEVFEPRQNRLDGRSRQLSTPIHSSIDVDVLFAVAIENESKIVVGLQYKVVDGEPVDLFYADVSQMTNNIAIFIYDIIGNSWVRHMNNLCLKPSALLCEPITAGCCLYWFDKKMCAYDLNTGHYFEGSVEDGWFMHVVGIDCITSRKLTLIHLVGDFFFLIWADWRDLVQHFTMVRVFRTNIVQTPNYFKLRVIVLSCQTSKSYNSTYLQSPALLL